MAICGTFQCYIKKECAFCQLFRSHASGFLTSYPLGCHFFSCSSKLHFYSLSCHPGGFVSLFICRDKLALYNTGHVLQLHIFNMLRSLVHPASVVSLIYLRYDDSWYTLTVNRPKILQLLCILFGPTYMKVWKNMTELSFKCTCSSLLGRPFCICSALLL